MAYAIFVGMVAVGAAFLWWPDIQEWVKKRRLR
jgi:hypothetical protein